MNAQTGHSGGTVPTRKTCNNAVRKALKTVSESRHTGQRVGHQQNYLLTARMPPSGKAPDRCARLITSNHGELRSRRLGPSFCKASLTFRPLHVEWQDVAGRGASVRDVFNSFKPAMIAVDLFAGAGGMSLGARLAGIDVRLAIECDPHATATYTHNHPDTRLRLDDIRNVKRIGIGKNGSSTVLFGGPPCQGFSTSNQRTRSKSNQSNWLFREFIRLVKSWRPDWVVFENVKGILETENGAFVESVLRELEDAGYRTCRWLLNAADFGVPQRRHRLFVIGSRHGIQVTEPRKMAKARVTVKQAISDLPTLENGAAVDALPYPTKPRYRYARMMRGELDRCVNHLVTRNAAYVIRRYCHVPQGGNWEDIPAKLMKNYRDRSRCHTGIYHRLSYTEPSVVIGNFRKNMLIHPKQDRGLSVREAARLQSFPDWYEFKGSIGFQQQQVGNSVPPLLAKAVFDTILRADAGKEA